MKPHEHPRCKDEGVSRSLLLAAISCLAVGGCHLIFPFDASRSTDGALDAAPVDVGSFDRQVDRAAADDAAADAAPPDTSPAPDLAGPDTGPAPDLAGPDTSPAPDLKAPEAGPTPDLSTLDGGICSPTVNLALQATASSSGGGTNTVGPHKMNDGYGEASCGTQFYHWVFASLSGWIQLDWSTPVTVGSVWFDTSPPAGTCSVGIDRTLAGGVLEHWNGTTWVPIKTTTGRKADWGLTFPAVTTTKLRLYKTVAVNTAFHPVIFEWEVTCK